jgi:multidrug efflux pump subunit AcrA (membrane-fusion protein)
VLTKVAFESLDSRVLPEMSARINFLSVQAESAQYSPTAGVTVPGSALTTRDGRMILFRVDGDYATSVNVETGRELADKVEILSGLKAGDRVVLSPPGKMNSGQKIELATD